MFSRPTVNQMPLLGLGDVHVEVMGVGHMGGGLEGVHRADLVDAGLYESLGILVVVNPGSCQSRDEGLQLFKGEAAHTYGRKDVGALLEDVGLIRSMTRSLTALTALTAHGARLKETKYASYKPQQALTQA
jgi:hypothetical protein